MYDSIVIGGGLSGLVCAWRLTRNGRRVLLIEANSQAGGCIGSTRDNGFLMEAGPNSALETTPLIGQLLDELGISAQKIEPSSVARNRYILRNGRLIALPLSPPAFIASGLFSARAKLRLLREPFIAPAPASAEESVADFVRRRLGDEFLDYAINPFVAGVYAGDPARLSVRAAFPRLYELEQKYGSLIRGAIAGSRERRRNPEKSKQSARMFSFTEGMQTLTAALASRLSEVLLDTKVVALAKAERGFRVVAEKGENRQELTARSVIVATPAYAAAPLVAPFAQTASDALDAIDYPPVAVAISAYRRDDVKHALDGFGALLPQCEGRRTLGSIFSSSLFPNRAPAGTVLLTTFAGGMRDPALAREDESAIASVVQMENAQLFGAPPRAQFVRVRRWPRAIPQYASGHLDRISAIEGTERAQAGIYFCANYRGGIAVGDCIKSATQTGERAADFLSASE